MARLKTTEVYRSQVLDRTFRLLDILGNDGDGLGITELADKLRLHKSTTHRLIMVLESSCYVERNSSTGKYRIGSRLMQLGLSALSRLDIYETAKPHLRMLVNETGETAHLGVFQDGEVFSLLTVESTQTIRTPSTIGKRHDAHSSALGKAILAFSAEEVVESFLTARELQKHTRNTITSPTELRREFETIRRCGYSVDDEEREEGLRCIGAPVRGNSGEVMGALSIAGPVFRLTRDRNAALASCVVRASDQISRALGYIPDLKNSTQH
jgi:DNA-binding IclR family transcriptional regulator